MDRKYTVVFASILAVAAVVFTVTLTGCNENKRETSADKVQREATANLMNEAQKQVGMPNIINFQERKLMKMIMELRDQEDLVTYAYITAKYTGKLIYIGQCVGFGLPYSVQFTSPMRLATGGNSSGYWGTPMPQPDPNGLFMPGGLSATWLMMLDPETKNVRPVYVEPEIIVSPFKLHVDGPAEAR